MSVQREHRHPQKLKTPHICIMTKAATRCNDLA